MQSMLRSVIVAGTIAFASALPALVLADVPRSTAEPVVWRLSADGDWLVGLGADSAPVPAPLRPTTLRPSYAEPRLTGTPVRPAIVLRIDGGGDGAAAATAAPGCGLPLWMSLGGAGACLGTPIAPTGVTASIGWAGPQFEVGVHADASSRALPASGILSLAGPAASAAAAWPLVVGTAASPRIAMERYGLDGRVRLGEELGLRWSAGISRAEPLGAWDAGDLGFDQQALSLGLTRGTWSGGLTGRLTRPRPAIGASAEFGALDLEVQWLTPWDGELSFGAENLILLEPDRQPALPPVRNPQAPARTPFVRYRQDF